jgi:uroporphyrin-III C-methyltransferase
MDAVFDPDSDAESPPLTGRSPGKVWFVGAGPGAADLLTVRAIRVLARADVVLHDALVPDAVLEWAPSARLEPVGKRCDAASTAQSFIDRALVDAARRHRVVVRLKGGDPVVFGRLDEEIAALDAAGIDWEVVPGITAASAAAATAGHSLTLRGEARSVAIVTPRIGHGEPDNDAWADSLAPGTTVALYMASRIADRCARTLLRRGFAPDTPVVTVRGASLPGESVERGTLGALATGFGVDAGSDDPGGRHPATGRRSADTRPAVLLVGRALGGEVRPTAAAAALAADAVAGERVDAQPADQGMYCPPLTSMICPVT